MAAVTRFEVLSGTGAVGYQVAGDFLQAGTSTNTILIDNIATVPELSTYAMALAGLACGGYLVRRRRKHA